CFLLSRRPPMPSLFPYTTLFRSRRHGLALWNANWYGGHHTPGYGIVFPWVAAITGLAVPAILSTVGSVLLLARLMRKAALPHVRSEEHTSELQSRENLVCRLLLE